jgi:predicted esterase
MMLESDKTLRAEIDLYYDVFLPDVVAEPVPLLIAVHGYGAHKRYMMREARSVAPDNWTIASIQAPHQHFRKTDDGYRVGFGWLTEHKPEEYVALHHNFIIRVIERMSAEGKIDPGQVYLYGFSQACALNFRFAFTYPERLRGVIGVCGGIPGDLETNPVYQPFPAPVLYLHGNDDEFYDQEQFAQFDKRLSRFAARLIAKKYKAKHEISEEMRTDIRGFLAEMR